MLIFPVVFMEKKNYLSVLVEIRNKLDKCWRFTSHNTGCPHPTLPAGLVRQGWVKYIHTYINAKHYIGYVLLLHKYLGRKTLL